MWDNRAENTCAPELDVIEVGAPIKSLRIFKSRAFGSSNRVFKLNRKRSAFPRFLLIRGPRLRALQQRPKLANILHVFQRQHFLD